MKDSRAGKNRTRLAEKIPVEIPYVVGFFTGDICNFKCKYCAHSLGEDIYRIDKDVVPQMMEWSVFKKAADDLKVFSQPIKKTQFCGTGETLLNKNLPEMIKYLKDNRLTEFCEVVTNGSLLTHELTQKLVDAGLDRLCVSIQGVTARKYKEISQVDLDFEHIVDELRYFYQYSREKCKVHIKTVNIALEEGEDDTFYKIFSPISDTTHIDNVMECFQDVDYSDIVPDKSNGLYGGVKNNRVVCPNVFYTLHILSDGRVVTCCAPPFPVILGEVQNKSLIDMWNGDKRLNFLKMQLEGNRMKHPVCKNCVLLNATNFKEDDLDDDRERLLVLLQKEAIVFSEKSNV